MARCQHEPVVMFDRPPAGNTAAGHSYALMSHEWVICRRCSALGYWGRRRIRWGYGSDHVIETLAHYEAQCRGENPKPAWQRHQENA